MAEGIARNLEACAQNETAAQLKHPHRHAEYS